MVLFISTYSQNFTVCRNPLSKKVEKQAPKAICDTSILRDEISIRILLPMRFFKMRLKKGEGNVKSKVLSVDDTAGIQKQNDLFYLSTSL